MEILKVTTMKKTIFNNMRSYAIVMLALVGISLVSCDKKELCYKVHPHDKAICNTTFTITIDPSYTNDIEITTDEDLYSGDYVMRYTAEVWSLDNAGNLDQMYERFQVMGGEYTGEKIVEELDPVLLPALDVRLLVWADPIDPTGEIDPAFDVESLQAVTMNEVGNSKAKDGFTLSQDILFEQYAYELDGIDLEVSVELKRAFGRHRIIANDLSIFLEDNDDIPEYINIDYQFYVATQYNCFLDMLQSAQASQSYKFTPVALSDNHLLIAEDYLFMSTDDTDESFNYYVVPTGYDSKGKAVSSTSTIAVPNTLNTTEVVYGAFLTDQSNVHLGIDDEFDGEIVIEIED